MFIQRCSIGSATKRGDGPQSAGRVLSGWPTVMRENEFHFS